VTPPARDTRAPQTEIAKLGEMMEQMTQSIPVMSELGKQVLQSNP
jgi:hypothetical protein